MCPVLVVQAGLHLRHNNCFHRFRPGFDYDAWEVLRGQAKIQVNQEEIKRAVTEYVDSEVFASYDILQSCAQYVSHKELIHMPF